jgi:hypothetical protein
MAGLIPPTTWSFTYLIEILCCVRRGCYFHDTIRLLQALGFTSFSFYLLYPQLLEDYHCTIQLNLS